LALLDGTIVALLSWMHATHNPDSWRRFESMIAAMSPGDVITVNEAVYETDMDAESVQVVLDVLTRADLFEHHGEQFMRLTSSSGSGPFGRGQHS
jgi:hypothetical protein